MRYVDHGRNLYCGRCRYCGPVIPQDKAAIDAWMADWRRRMVADVTTDIERVTDMRSISIGGPAAQKNCRNCGAPHEPKHPHACGWCTTPR